MDHFKGKIAIVTGAASGIGRSLSEELGLRGAIVIAADINESAAGETAKSITAAGGKAKSVRVDVVESGSVQDLVDETFRQYGRLDFMFNNAGVAVVGEVRDLTLEHWRKVIDVNLWGVIYGTTSAYKVMVAQGSGHIVNTASVSGLIPSPTLAPYSVTKHAVVGLSTALRAEGAALGVKVSAVCPGLVQTAIHQSAVLVNTDRDIVLEKIPVKPIAATLAARKILRGVAHNREIIVFPAHARIMWTISRLSRAVIQSLARRAAREFRKVRTN